MTESERRHLINAGLAAFDYGAPVLARIEEAAEDEEIEVTDEELNEIIAAIHAIVRE